MHISPLIHVALSLLISLASPSSAIVTGIDLGTDWLKSAVIKHGGVIETVLDRESKRKSPAAVAVVRGVRSYGAEAVSHGMRFPQTTFTGIKNLIGKRFDSHAASTYRSTSHVSMVNTSRGTVAFKVPNTTGSLDGEDVYTVEEVTAMMLAHIKKMVAAHVGVGMSGAVIAVPPYFTHFERQALMDAAEIADVKVYGIMNDETAVAINYAIGKKFDTPKRHLFYDMGAGSTVATLINFQTTQKGVSKSTAQSSPQLEMTVMSVGCDQTLGGNAIDVRMQRFLATAFMQMHFKDTASGSGGGVFEDSRAMSRLLKEANRVKQILSANTYTFASVESLYGGIDFRVKVTREDLERECADLFERVSQPIETALATANATIEDIESVVLVGGGVRVPAVQTALTRTVGAEKIARNINGDEAAMHGAVFRGASLSGLFRLGLQIKIRDLNPVPVEVSYEVEKKDQDAVQRTLRTVLYTQSSYLGTRKLMTFKRTSDFTFTVAYTTPSSSDTTTTASAAVPTTTPIARVTVKGLTQAMQTYKDKMTDKGPDVKVMFEMSESGIVVVSGGYAVFEVDADKDNKASIKDAVLNFFSGSKGGEENANAEEDVPDEEVTAATESSSSTMSASTPTPTASTPKTTTTKAPLTLEIEWQTARPLTTEEKAVSRGRLAAMDAQDREREHRDASRNKLESFLYKCKEMLWDDATEQYASEEEMAAFKGVVGEIGEWLEEHSEQAGVYEFQQRYKQLMRQRGVIEHRRIEHGKRDSAVEAFERVYAKMRQQIEEYGGMKDEDGGMLYSVEELKRVNEQIEADEAWKRTTIEAQQKRKMSEDPVLLSKDLDKRRVMVEVAVNGLDKPEVRKAKKKKTLGKKESGDSSSGGSSNDDTSKGEGGDSNDKSSSSSEHQSSSNDKSSSHDKSSSSDKSKTKEKTEL